MNSKFYNLSPDEDDINYKLQQQHEQMYYELVQKPRERQQLIDDILKQIRPEINAMFNEAKKEYATDVKISFDKAFKDFQNDISKFLSGK